MSAPSISRFTSQSSEKHVVPDEDAASESPSSIRAGEAIMAFAREIASFTMRTYDITKALELWSKSEDTTYLRLSTNVLIRGGDALSNELDHEWRQFHRSWRNEIQLDKSRCIFYTLPYTVGYAWLSNGALECGSFCRSNYIRLTRSSKLFILLCGAHAQVIACFTYQQPPLAQTNFTRFFHEALLWEYSHWRPSSVSGSLRCRSHILAGIPNCTS